MCGLSEKETKQEVRSKTEKSESDAPVTKNERKEVESPKNDSQEEMKSDTIKRKNTTAEDGGILPPTKRQHSCDHQIPYTPSDFAIKFFEDRSALPFPGASRRFYQKQNVRANAKVKRTKRRTQLPVIQNKTKAIGIQRSRVEGSLEDNIKDINREILTCNNRTRRAELLATADVGRELQKSILMETSMAAAIFKKTKASILNEEEKAYFCPVYTYEQLSKKLNIVQIYIDQKAHIVEGKDTDINKVVKIITTRLNQLNDSVVKGLMERKLKDNFADVLQYLDSKRDRDVLEAIIAKISSIKSVISIKGTQFTSSVSKHRATLNSDLKKFKQIRFESQTVRSDMTSDQQHSRVQRQAKQLKQDTIKTIAKGRGRKLKCEEFPELARYIEFAFGEGDRLVRGGGGLQADPRLLDARLFKAADNATVMRDVKEMLNTVKPEFNISTSCLYTYTKNCRKGTLQAKRHHHGREVNANVSLHKAPNTSEQVVTPN